MALKLSSLTDMAALAELGFNVAQRVGKWGIPGVVLIDVQAAIGFIRHPSWDAAGSYLGTTGWCLVIISILANTKRLKDMQVTVAAESKIQNPNYAPTSADPAIRGAIERLQANPAALAGMDGVAQQRATADVKIPKASG